jgi:glycosidase
MFLRNHDQTRTLSEFAGDVARNKLAVSLLLTLPGLPFVYYGEEIGMTGFKRDGDPRLRTPMQWSRAPAAGFTRGTPWEPLPPDSFTANVEVLENDANSLLNLHRRLIHLRAANPAFGAAAEFIPLNASAPGALAYLRRANGRAAVVIANLTAQRLSRVSVSSVDSVLPSGRYTATTQLGARRDMALRIARNGRIESWRPLAVLGPFETQIIELSIGN